MMEKDGSIQGSNIRFWHFIVTILGTFAAVLIFTKSMISEYSYPRMKGEALERSIDRMSDTLETTNSILTDLRIFIASQIKVTDKRVQITQEQVREIRQAIQNES